MEDLDPVMLWLCAIGGIALVIAGVTSIWSWANQFFNWKYDSKRYQDKLKEIKAANKANAKVEIREPKMPKWRRARAQQIGVLRYGYPWGLLLLAAMGYLVYSGFDTKVYIIFAASWFVLRHVRYSHKMRRIVKLNRVLNQDGFVPGHKLLPRTAREYIRHHYDWGFSEPSFVGKFKKHQKKIHWYYGPAIFRYPVNWTCNAVMTVLKFRWLRKLFHLRVVIPLVWYGTIDLFWPLTGAMAVLINTAVIMSDDHDTEAPDTEPFWALDSPEPPYARPLPAPAAQNPPQAENDSDAEGDNNTPADGRTEFTTKTDEGYTYGTRPAQPNVHNG